MSLQHSSLNSASDNCFGQEICLQSLEMPAYFRSREQGRVFETRTRSLCLLLVIVSWLSSSGWWRKSFLKPIIVLPQMTVAGSGPHNGHWHTWCGLISRRHPNAFHAWRRFLDANRSCVSLRKDFCLQPLSGGMKTKNHNRWDACCLDWRASLLGHCTCAYSQFWQTLWIARIGKKNLATHKDCQKWHNLLGKTAIFGNFWWYLNGKMEQQQTSSIQTKQPGKVTYSSTDRAAPDWQNFLVPKHAPANRPGRPVWLVKQQIVAM